ncbi:hypothetical protein CYMTET_6459 [Cymbomonas tetramitiformis]|uniref:Uncharacterized protein n=1 Tax=Cymbomonas tetramitiformis TaxID=36881 RepID=A0AAE0GXD1_9CHLO|nr:hypothetical protein CYMTET_6459 [Cymbomonas tetramitiformis]
MATRMKKLFTVGSDCHGRGRVLYSWSSKGSHLATVGNRRKVFIWDRNGRLYDEIHLPSAEAVKPAGVEEETASACVALEWDSTGERLALLPSGITTVLLYTLATRDTTKLDTNMKELAFLSWAKSAKMLAVGTGKGNVLIYNDALGKKVPIMGKHTRRITCGAWNSEGRLALGSEDRQVTVSKSEGDTIRQLGVKMEPTEIYFHDKKDEEKKLRKENTISINVGRKTIYLYRVFEEDAAAEADQDRDNPIELAFQERYGNIQCHRWFGEGYILIGFQSGFVVVISTHNKEMSEEVHSARYHKDVLSDVAYCGALDRAATCGGNLIKIIDMVGQECNEIKSDSIEFESNVVLDKLQWTQDGQVLSVSTQGGDVHSYLASLPVINDVCETRLVYLTSLLELTVLDVLTDDISKIQIETEPAFVALGTNHVAVGMNNQAWFYRIDSEGQQAHRVNQRDYLGTVEEVQLNERYAAVLSEGRVQLHVIEAGEDPGEEEDLIYPDKGHANDISCVGMTQNFLMFGTKRGSIHYYYLEDKALVNEYRHEDGEIRQLYPNPPGTRVLFVDGRHAVNLFNPVNDQVLPVPKFTGALESMLWDSADPNVFVLADNRQFYVYVYTPVSISGALISFVGTTARPTGFCPILMYNGMITCQLKSGSLERVMLTTHTSLQGQDRGILEKMKRRFNQHLALLHFKEAWEVALQVKNGDMWSALTETALTFMEVEIAIRAFRYNGNAGMVLSLQKISHLEDKNLLAGHICVLLEQDYSTAQVRRPPPPCA